MKLEYQQTTDRYYDPQQVAYDAVYGMRRQIRQGLTLYSKDSITRYGIEHTATLHVFTDKQIKEMQEAIAANDLVKLSSLLGTHNKPITVRPATGEEPTPSSGAVMLIKEHCDIMPVGDEPFMNRFLEDSYKRTQQIHQQVSDKFFQDNPEYQGRTLESLGLRTSVCYEWNGSDLELIAQIVPL